MQTWKIKCRNDKEQRAFDWFKRHNRGRWLAYALTDLAYDPYHQGHDWRRTKQGISRHVWCHWGPRPFGNDQMNAMHQLAKIVIRRAVYFSDLKALHSLNPSVHVRTSKRRPLESEK